MAKKKAVEADLNLPPTLQAASNDYECVGFDNPAFGRIQSPDGANVAAEQEDEYIKVDQAEDSI